MSRKLDLGGETFLHEGKPFTGVIDAEDIASKYGNEHGKRIWDDLNQAAERVRRNNEAARPKNRPDGSATSLTDATRNPADPERPFTGLNDAQRQELNPPGQSLVDADQSKGGGKQTQQVRRDEPERYGDGNHPLEFFDDRSDEEILKLAGIGEGTLAKIRQAQQSRDAGKPKPKK